MSFQQYAGDIKVEAWATIVLDSKNLGYTGKPTVKITPEYLDKVTSQTGKIPLGASFIGAAFEVVIPVYKTDLEMLQVAIPWYSAQGGFKLLPNALGQDLYDYAKLLTLHPLSSGASTDRDINILKAAPIGAQDWQRDGEGYDVLPITFRVFPDRSKLPSLVWGYIGDVPG